MYLFYISQVFPIAYNETVGVENRLDMFLKRPKHDKTTGHGLWKSFALLNDILVLTWYL